MGGKILTVANMKGGVGKTTVVVCLAETLAAHGKHVLVIDLDAQANASFSLAGDTLLLELIQGGRTIDAFLEDRIILELPRRLGDLIQLGVGALQQDAAPVGSVSLIAASPELRIAEREVIAFASRDGRSLKDAEGNVAHIFQEELEAQRAIYDYVVLDCAPGISILTEAALISSDLVIVPTVPDFISNLGLEAFCKTVQLSADSSERRAPWVLANRVRRTPAQIRILEEMRAESCAADAGFMMFCTELPERVEMEEATYWPGERLPYKSKYGVMAHVLDQLVREV